MLSGGGGCQFADLDTLRLGGAPARVPGAAPGEMAEVRLELMPLEGAAVPE